MIQTHRNATGIDDWGGGLGDVALTARYDFIFASESLYWPGLGLLAGSTFPTGRAPDEARQPLAADATGAGTYNATLGVDISTVRGHLYASLQGWMTHRFSRTQSIGQGAALNQSFSLRWTALGVASYVFDSEAAVGVYVSSMNEGASTIDGVREPTTSLRLTTAGVAGALPIRDVWRLQGAVFGDVPLQSFGRNQPVGYGLTASLVRAWF
jgi:hypothetical protein